MVAGFADSIPRHSREISKYTWVCIHLAFQLLQCFEFMMKITVQN